MIDKPCIDIHHGVLLAYNGPPGGDGRALEGIMHTARARTRAGEEGLRGRTVQAKPKVLSSDYARQPANRPCAGVCQSCQSVIRCGSVVTTAFVRAYAFGGRFGGQVEASAHPRTGQPASQPARPALAVGSGSLRGYSGLLVHKGWGGLVRLTCRKTDDASSLLCCG